jgi:DNA-directed RNA polymerase specialized sigma24 family protein
VGKSNEPPKKTVAGRQRWTLDAGAFQALLQRLSADGQRGGERFRILHTKLAAYFTHERCAYPERWADETLDRMAKRISEGQQIEDPNAFAYGVARMVLQEARKAEQRDRDVGARAPVRPRTPEAVMQCLDRCLEALSDQDRNLIRRYYAAARPSDRQGQADELGIGIEALRTRALRIRKRLEDCVTRCREAQNVTAERISPFSIEEF